MALKVSSVLPKTDRYVILAMFYYSTLVVVLYRGSSESKCPLSGAQRLMVQNSHLH